MKRLVKSLLLVVFGLAMAGAIVYTFIPKPIEADVATVTRGPIRVTIDEDGKTRIKERYIVSAPLEGRMMRIRWHPGDPVVAGQTLVASIEPVDPALLDPRQHAEAQARVDAAHAALQRANPTKERALAMLELAESDRERLHGQFEAKAASRKELDDATLLVRIRKQEYKAAGFAQDIARFELDQARAALLRTQPQTGPQPHTRPFEIFAPCGGRILRVFQEDAAVVSAGLPILEIGDPRDLEVEVDVLSSDAVVITPGADVWFEQWGGSEPLRGVVRLVEPSAFTKVSALGVEEQRVNVIIDLVAPPDKWNTLGDGYRVEAQIVVWEGQDVLKVPAGTLFRQDEDWAVFLIKNNRAVIQQVKIGHRSGLEAEILSGLDEADRVILHPSDKISNGVRVSPR